MSHYFPGPRGTGKSVWLALLGRALKQKGEQVYHIKHAGALRKMNVSNFSSLGSADKPVYLLVDEVQENPSDEMWGYLLKEDNKGIVVIGAGIPAEGGISPAFITRHDPNELLLADEDFDAAFLAHFASILAPVVLPDTLPPKDSTTAVQELLYWLLSYTNGHTYPLLKLGDYIITNHSDLCFTDSGFKTVIGGAFYESAICKDIEARCYGLNNE